MKFHFKLAPRFLVLVTAFLVVFDPSHAPAQVAFSQQAEEEFNRGISYYKKSEYAAAAQAFANVTRLPVSNQRTTAAFIMKAKAELYANRSSDAEKTLQAFLSAYPRSSYVCDAHFTLGLAFLKLHNAERALGSLLQAFRIALNGHVAATLQEEIVKTLDETINSFIDLPALERLSESSTDQREFQFILLKLAEKQIARGDYATASTTLQSFRKKFDQSHFESRYSDLEAKILKPRELKFGVVLPLMKGTGQGGREKEIGTSLLEGIELAVNEFNSKSDQHVSLNITDSGRDIASGVNAVRGLAVDPSILCIIGPAFSPVALAVAPVANEFHVPLVTPTANANGIAATGPYVFQANPDLETRARAVAQYAVKDLKLRRLAILSSSELSSKSLAQTFEREARRQGAEIVGVEFYDKGSSDLMQQLSSLRKKASTFSGEPYIQFSERMSRKDLTKLLKLGVAQKTLDTLVARKSLVNANDLLGDNARTLLDAVAFSFLKTSPHADSIGIPLKSIQGLYCPISSSAEIGVVTSQLAYYNIQTKILGSGEWNNLSELNVNRAYCKSVAFESDSYTDVKDSRYQNFVNSFNQKYTKSPNRNVLYGYGVMKTILSVLSQGAVTREKLQAALSEVRNFEVPHSRISFAPLRVNSWLHILEYSPESIRHIREIRVE